MGWVHHQTGEVSRIRANSGCGTRDWSRSGSVKSNPSGRWGQGIGSSRSRTPGRSESRPSCLTTHQKLPER